ncbi:hypothetical protein Dda_3439 [Drechslerella dactyloides]|uniref:Uncharacterized protein n=1 Tax=Drechslerella dactyloides TaxID=74499 RepID=A0AAD6NLK0_DREDA|nr:hypothetical protein Dda_3439 [Drechslerella dactyloides]
MVRTDSAQPVCGQMHTADFTGITPKIPIFDRLEGVRVQEKWGFFRDTHSSAAEVRRPRSPIPFFQLQYILAVAPLRIHEVTIHSLYYTQLQDCAVTVLYNFQQRALRSIKRSPGQ